MKLLNKKNILVTGASRGIGKGIVKLFAEHGANIAFTYHSSDSKAEILENQLAKNGCKVKKYKSDASDFDSAEKLINNVLLETGPKLNKSFFNYNLINKIFHFESKQNIKLGGISFYKVLKINKIKDLKFKINSYKDLINDNFITYTK